MTALGHSLPVARRRAGREVRISSKADLKSNAMLSPEEVARFLDAAPGLKYKSVAYGAGLRVSEVVALKVGSSLPVLPGKQTC
jgi:integrase